MDAEAAAKKNLYDAATNGDLTKFQQLLQEDQYLVNEASFAHSRNLLHIATMHGQLAIVEAVLKINPQLAQEIDSKQSSPLHIAAAQGHVGIATKLFAVAPEMCWLRDCQGMNPFHIAAMNGHVDILRELLPTGVVHPAAKEKVRLGQTVLHLCVKHGCLAAMEFLVGKLDDLVHATDDDGETVLHLAVRCNQFEAVQYLVKTAEVIKKDNVRNSMGKTALDILKEIPEYKISNYSEFKKILKKISYQPLMENTKVTKITMVVAGLIATMAFQAALNPPGGVWQDNGSHPVRFVPINIDAVSKADPLSKADPQGPGPNPIPSPSPSPTNASHKAGEAIMESTNPELYRIFTNNNDVALATSFITIYLVMTGFPSRNFKVLWVSLITMIMSITSISCSYMASVAFIADPGAEPPSYLLGNWDASLFIYVGGLLPMAILFGIDYFKKIR